MQLLGISGSLRKHSYNSALLRSFAAMTQNQQNKHMSLFDQLAHIPPFIDKEDGDDENENNPALLQFKQQVKQASAIIISTPEYAHGLPGALKNALDWMVSYESIVLKPIALMSVSTSALGGYRAHAALVYILNAMNTRLIIDASIHVPFAKAKFDDKGRIVDQLLLDRINNSLNIIYQATL